MGLGEKKKAVTKYNFQGLPLRLALPITGISKHQYYYRSKPGTRGNKPSETTPYIKDGQSVSVPNSQVVRCIENIHRDPDLRYGYHAMTKDLQHRGYKINHKKTYRLMKENHLLQEKKKTPSKTYVQYRKVHPTRPLEVLEMDIKLVWVEHDRRHAFVLNIIDTFTRKWLYQATSFSIKQQQVKQAWQYLIVNYLQPTDALRKGLHIEIRNDNDKRFSAYMVQEFFKENHLNQVFTHPYTPQENAHVESFHKILSNHIERFTFWSINQLEQNLILFMEKYNNQRLHSSIAYLSPNDFEQIWNLGHIQMSSNLKKRKIIFKLNIPRHLVRQYTGNNEPEGSSSHDFKPLDVAKNQKKRAMVPSPQSNLRYKKSPSVAPRTTNIKLKITNFENLKC